MIGFFDSGIGGLTVVKEVLKVLSEYQILYLGDTARAPYGNRSQDLIYQFTEQAVDFLFKQGCHLIIIACNTASAEALRKIQREWLPKHYPERRVLGVIRPIVEEAAQATRFAKIGVVGTRGTIESSAFIRELEYQRSDLEIHTQACPLLVPLVEEGWQGRPETNRIIRRYVRPLKDKKIDTLILGCTHYSMLYKDFVRIMGKSCQVLEPGKIVTESLKDYLRRHPEIESKLEKNQNHRFLVTDLTEKFKVNAQNWLGQRIELEQVSLVSPSRIYHNR